MTRTECVRMPAYILAKYPDGMTVVLQYEFGKLNDATGVFMANADATNDADGADFRITILTGAATGGKAIVGLSASLPVDSILMSRSVRPNWLRFCVVGRRSAGKYGFTP